MRLNAKLWRKYMDAWQSKQPRGRKGKRRAPKGWGDKRRLENDIADK